MKAIILTLSMIPAFAYAGSFIPMLENFEVSSSQEIEAIPPDFYVKSIRRGTDNGNFASTSDAGIITLQLNEIPVQKQGYLFEIVEGKFEDQLFFDEPVMSTEYVDEGSFSFVWLDGSSRKQEPFDITVRIIAISTSGAKSFPQLLQIKHEGVKSPWWHIW